MRFVDSKNNKNTVLIFAIMGLCFLSGSFMNFKFNELNETRAIPTLQRGYLQADYLEYRKLARDKQKNIDTLKQVLARRDRLIAHLKQSRNENIIGIDTMSTDDLYQFFTDQ